MKTLRQIREEHIRMVLDENGWDIKKASDVLQIPEDRLRREARRLEGPSGKQVGRGRRADRPDANKH